MIVEMDILEPVRQRLQEVLKRSVKAKAASNGSEGPDGYFIAGDFEFVVEVKGSDRLAAIHQACENARRHARKKSPRAIPLVAVSYMGPSGRQACVEEKVSFVDVAGNAHIEAPGLFVHVQGKRNPSSTLGRPSSVFAPRSSRVSRLLLLDPKRWWQQKDIADEAGIGRGSVSKVVARLASDGLLEAKKDGKVRPFRPNLLLDAWKDEYKFRRHKVVAGHVSARSGEELAERFAEAARQHKAEYSFTGLPAAAKLAPFAGFRLVAAYLRRPPKEALLQSLGFHREEKGANIWLVMPADEGVFAGSKEIEGHACVSPVQAYLDLMQMPERAKEAAVHLREVCLKWR